MNDPSGGVSTLIELHDSDILRLEGVLRRLNTRLGTSVPLEGFRKEIIERFGEAGFGVNVRVFETNVQSVYSFEIEICQRLGGAFDPDRMVHEVTNDILGLGEGGVIKTGPQLWTPGSHKH